MAFQAGAIVSQLTLDRAKFSASVKAVTGQVKNFGNVIKRNSAQIKRMGRQMTVAGAAVVGGLGMMVKAYGSFDEAMVRSLAIMGDVSPAMRKEMAKTAKELSTKSTFAAKDLAEAYYFLASAGMSAEASISALPPVSRFAQAGTFDLALATDLLTDAQTALGLSSKNVIENEKQLIRVSDVLVGANTLANASVLQFSEALTNKAAAAMVNLNIEVEEGVAVLAAYADKGVKGRLAGQRLTMMLNGLFDATRQNKEVWDGVGISLFEADGSMRAMADIIQDLEGYLGDMTVEQREAALATLGFNIKTKDSILTLMGSSEKIREWTGDLKKMGGITKEVADKQMEAFNAKMTVLKNTVIKAAIGIGQSLAPTIVRLAEKIKNVAERIAAWIDEHPELTAVITKLVAGIGALMLILGPLAMILPGLVTGFVLLKVAVIALAGPVGLAAVALLGIAIAIKEIIKTHKEALKAMEDMALGARIMGNAAENFKKLWIKVRKEGGPALEQFNELMTRFGGNWDKILKQIIADPKLAVLKAMLIKVARTVKGISTEGENLSITLPGSFVKVEKAAKKTIPVFDMWATTVAKIFHDTSVRAAEMRAKMKDVKLILPPVAINMPKMSLKDLRDFYVAWLKELKEKWAETWKDTFWRILSSANLFISSLDSLFDQLTTRQMARIDAEYEARRAAIDNSIMTEKRKADAIERLDAETEKKRKKAQRTAAKRTKAISLFQAIVGTAAAIVQAMNAPFPLNIILPIIIGAMGAAQIAIIASEPLPELAKGGRLGRGQLGIVGEEGPELFAPDTSGTVVPMREGAGFGALRPVYVTIAPSYQVSTIDEVGVRDFMRDRGLPAMVEAIKVGIQKSELQDALRIK